MKKAMPSYLFYKDNITLISKTGKCLIRKEYYRLNPSKNIAAKILNKILANGIQYCIEIIVYHDQVRFIPGA